MRRDTALALLIGGVLAIGLGLAGPVGTLEVVPSYEMAEIGHFEDQGPEDLLIAFTNEAGVEAQPAIRTEATPDLLPATEIRLTAEARGATALRALHRERGPADASTNFAPRLADREPGPLLE